MPLKLIVGTKPDFPEFIDAESAERQISRLVAMANNRRGQHIDTDIQPIVVAHRESEVRVCCTHNLPSRFRQLLTGERVFDNYTADLARLCCSAKPGTLYITSSAIYWIANSDSNDTGADVSGNSGVGFSIDYRDCILHAISRQDLRCGPSIYIQLGMGSSGEGTSLNMNLNPNGDYEGQQQQEEVLMVTANDDSDNDEDGDTIFELWLQPSDTCSLDKVYQALCLCAGIYPIAWDDDDDGSRRDNDTNSLRHKEPAAGL